MIYARGDLLGRSETEPIFATTARLGLPVFLHGGAGALVRDSSLDVLDDGGQGVSVSAHAVSWHAQVWDSGS